MKLKSIFDGNWRGILPIWLECHVGAKVLSADTLPRFSVETIEGFLDKLGYFLFSVEGLKGIS